MNYYEYNIQQDFCYFDTKAHYVGNSYIISIRYTFRYRQDDRKTRRIQYIDLYKKPAARYILINRNLNTYYYLQTHVVESRAIYY